MIPKVTLYNYKGTDRSSSQYMAPLLLTITSEVNGRSINAVWGNALYTVYVEGGRRDADCIPYREGSLLEDTPMSSREEAHERLSRV